MPAEAPTKSAGFVAHHRFRNHQIAVSMKTLCQLHEGGHIVMSQRQKHFGVAGMMLVLRAHRPRGGCTLQFLVWQGIAVKRESERRRIDEGIKRHERISTYFQFAQWHA